MPTQPPKTVPFRELLASSPAAPEGPRRLSIPTCAMGGHGADPARQWIDGESTASRPVTLLARTAEVIDHWWFGPIVHDFAGMRRKDRISLDDSHDYSSLVGYADQFTIDERGLTVSGQIISRAAGDSASRIMADADAGIPLEASIDWSRGQVVLEEVPDGATTQVNGRTIAGPVTVVRQWELIAVAVCPHGADGGTSASIGGASEASRDAEASQPEEEAAAATSAPASDPASDPADPPADQAILVTVRRFAAPAPVTRLAPPPPIDDEPDSDLPARASVVKGRASNSPTTQPTPEPTSPTKPAIATPADERAKLTQYVEHFGAEAGARWFVAGRPIEECWPDHVASLQSSHAQQVASLEAELTKLRARIAAVDRGEPTALSANPEPHAGAEPTRRQAKSGPTISPYAEAINARAAALQAKR